MSRGFAPSFWYILRMRLQGKQYLYEFYFKGKKTLDIGCGEGEFLKADPLHITGVEPNPAAVERLRAQNFNVIEGRAEALPFPDNSFEAVHSRNVIEHLPVPIAYALLTEAARVVVPGGIVVVASEVVTDIFWDTFGHIKPYPPNAILKLLRNESREEFEVISSLEKAGLFYFGDHHPNKILYLLYAFLGYFTPFKRREYFLILRKKGH